MTGPWTIIALFANNKSKKLIRKYAYQVEF